MSEATSYSIENAKSGRAGCKKCKEKIGKGEIRLGVSAPGPGDFNMQSWYHPDCFTLPRKLVQQGITAMSFVHDMLEDNTTDSILSTDKTADVIASVEKKYVKKKVEGADAGSKATHSKIDKIKRNVERMREEALKEDEESDSDDDARPKKKKKKAKKEDGSGEKALSPKDREEAEVYAIYRDYKNDDLKDVLRWNRQLVSGNRDMLLTRILDGHMNGRLGRCPTCHKGRMKLTEEDVENRTAHCNGYYDEDMATRVPCFFKCKLEQAPRLQPWFTREPTEEEAEAMNQADEDAKEGRGIDGGGDAGGGGGGGSSSVLLDLVSELPWDLSNSDGIKKAASSMLDVCESDESRKIDLPNDRKKARMEVGRIIVRNKDKSAKDILALVIEKFGYKKAKEEKAKRATEAISSVCAHPDNVKLMEAFLELGGLYFKEGNSNAGATYKKAAGIIKDLDFAITESNAKGLGKGKTKVPGIGKGSAEKFYEFVTTGKIEKLEEKRAAAS